MFKVNSKDTRKTLFSNVSIVDFEQVNICYVNSTSYLETWLRKVKIYTTSSWAPRVALKLKLASSFISLLPVMINIEVF